MAQMTTVTPPAPRQRPDPLDVIVAEHRAGLIAYAERLLHDRGLAEDVVQEAFIRAWRHIDRLHGTEGSVRGWLLTVTRRLVVDWVRKPHTRREVVGAGYSDPPCRADRIGAVHDALLAVPLLRTLSPEHRAVLVHLYLYDRTIQETAGILGVPPGTVKSRQYNALRKLRGAAGGGSTPCDTRGPRHA
ncbi:sigma-70 family RNA polymerase sigma factor [Streptomyces sp. NPDC092296]|uniref:sigma-70 family RNA polymerase sigma factor n=1 Tax=Streptomyces sp. NPDC092296 TaxID=3366012 RepID=UPI003820538E